MRALAWLLLTLVGCAEPTALPPDSAVGNSPLLVSPVLVADAPIDAPSPDFDMSGLVVWDGTQFVAVWRAQSVDQAGSQVVAARLSETGALLDSPPIVLATNLTIAGSGTLFASGGADSTLVLWLEMVGPDARIRATRLASDGKVLDQPPLVVAPPDVHAPVAAWNGTQWLVVWSDDTQSRVVGSRLSAQGQLLDPTPVVLQGAPVLLGVSGLASDGNQFLATWANGNGSQFDVVGKRVSAAGAVLDAAPLPIASGPRFNIQPTTAWDGQNFVVVMVDGAVPFPATFDLVSVRVAPSGTVLDAAPRAVAANLQPFERVALTRGAGGLLVAWASQLADAGFESRLETMLSDGTLLAGRGQRRAGAELALGTPWVAGGPNADLLVWGSSTDLMASDVFGARQTASGTVLDSPPLMLSRSPNHERTPASAFGGGRHLFVWADSRTGTRTIFGQLYNAAAQGQLAAAFAVSSPGATDPCTAWNGQAFLVGWSTFDSTGQTVVRARRVGVDGSLIGSEVAVSAGTLVGDYHCEVSSDADGWLVSWTSDNGPSTSEARMVRVSQGGLVLPPQLRLTADRSESPASSWDGTRYLLAYAASHDGGELDVYSTRVSSSGVVLDPIGVPIDTSPGNQLTPSVATGQGVWLFSWYDEGPGEYYARRFDSSGAPLGGRVLLDAIDPSALQDVPTPPVRSTWLGDRFLVAWAADAGLMGVEIFPDGGQRTPTLLADGPEASVSASSPDAGLLAFTATSDRRLRLRVVGDLAPLIDAGPPTADAGGPADGGATGDGGAAQPGDGGVGVGVGADGGQRGPRVLQVACGCSNEGNLLAWWALSLAAVRRRRSARAPW